MPFQVCHGATLKCSFGAAPSSLVVLPVNQTMTSNAPAANIMDNKPMVNVLPFGMCMTPANPQVAAATAAALGVLTPQPCIPVIPAPWAPGQPTIMIGNQPAVDNTCKLLCQWTGVIAVLMPGQMTHLIDGQAGGGGGGQAAPAPAVAGGATGAAGAAKPATAPGFKTGLGADVDAVAGKSPSLKKDLDKLTDDGWTVNYGTAGKGSMASRDKKTITIDSNLRGKPNEATQTLAHEVGHASYDYKADVSSKAKYVNGALADEGAATMNNIKVQREILAADPKTNIGIAGNAANAVGYNKAYDTFVKDGDAAAARQAIGSVFGKGEKTSNTNQPYADYYGSWYDKNYPPKK